MTVDRVAKTDKEWQKQLTPEQYYVTRKKGTEPAFTGRYWDHHEKGVYRCVCCGEPLFTSKDMPGLIPDLLVAQDKAIKAKRKDLVGMIKAWFDTVAFIKAQPDEAAKIMSKIVRKDLPPERTNT